MIADLVSELVELVHAYHWRWVAIHGDHTAGCELCAGLHEHHASALAALELAAETHAARYGQPPTTEEWPRKTPEHPSYTVVQRLFGSWAAGLAEAGYEPRPSGFQARNRRKQ